MGKKKTFSRASIYELLDWAAAADITVTEHGDGYLYGMVEHDGATRQIRLSRTGDFFQIDDGPGKFDRWANSVGSEARFPHSQQEFEETLRSLCGMDVASLALGRHG